MKPRNSMRGVALITAMLVTAIAASLAATLAWENALDVRRTTIMLYHEQGMQVALGAESWIKNLLRDDAADSPSDHLDEFWASELPGLPVDNGTVQGAVTGTVVDLQGRFNVNNLVDASGETNQVYVEQFERLLRVLELDERLAGIAADWLDSNDEANIPNGAEDSTYTGLTPPYRAYNKRLSNVTELAAIEGMDKASFDVLLPHITALPESGSAINVNTATPEVLMSLSASMDTSIVENLLENREGGGFANLDDVKAQAGIDTPAGQSGQSQITITDSSLYFQLKAYVEIGTVRITYYSVLARANGDVATLSRSQGTI